MARSSSIGCSDTLPSNSTLGESVTSCLVIDSIMAMEIVLPISRDELVNPEKLLTFE